MMSFDPTNHLETQDIDKEAAHFLADIENALTVFVPLSSPTDDVPSIISDEFVSLCLEHRGAPRNHVTIALQQIDALLETLPLPVLIQNSNCLTLRTLLQVALETQQEEPRLRCRSLGFLSLERRDSRHRDERTSEVQGELLTFFLLEPRRPWTDEQIFEALWPDKEPQLAQWSFHSARKRLHDFAGEEIIFKLKRGQYSLNPNLSIWFDVAEFESLLTRAQTIPTATARIKLLESAVQLYRGDFLEKNYKDWAVPVRNRLREKYIGALLQLGELNQREAPEQAIAWFEKALLADDLNEGTYLKLIELYVQRNDLISAQRTFILCMDTFRREFGTEPSPAFMQTVRSLLPKSGLKIRAKDK